MGRDDHPGIFFSYSVEREEGRPQCWRGRQKLNDLLRPIKSANFTLHNRCAQQVGRGGGNDVA